MLLLKMYFTSKFKLTSREEDMYTIEAFKDKIHLYANQQQSRALPGRFSPQRYPRITITRWANLPIYNGFLEEVGLSQMVDPLEIKRRSDATPVLELVKLGNYKTLLGCRYVDNRAPRNCTRDEG